MLIEKALARSLRVVFSGGVAIAGLGMLAQPAFAQNAAPAAAPIQRVEITGSAIKRIDAETAVPVTVVKMDDLKKQGITTIEQVMANLSSVQTNQGTSQVVGLSTGGASFADLRGIGANKTLVLLNGRRLANNALDSSAPDLNMIPFAALERVEVLRDGASSLYGSDAVGGVINFITRKDYTGVTVTAGLDSPNKKGGGSNSANIGVGYGNLDTDGFNIFAMGDHQVQRRINGVQRDYNKRYAGGLSPTTSPANYYQDGNSGNPVAPNCTGAPNLIPDATGSGCQMTTSSFVDYIPKSERNTGLVKGTIKLNENHELGLEYLITKSRVGSEIAPVPYGGLFQNRVRPDGSLNPFYPGNPGSITPNVPLSPTYTEENTPAGVLPGFVHVKWRDLPNGSRAGDDVNQQQRFVASLQGSIAGWDYGAAFTYNKNKVASNLIGYSDGGIITKGVLEGVINPYGEQSAAGTALIESAALNGNIQNAKGTMKGFDVRASREVGDWFGAGRPSALALGGQFDKQEFHSAANTEYAEKVVASTGIDPNTLNEGSRKVSAAYAELNLALLKDLDVTAAVRYDKYNDFGSTTNPKFGFRYQPTKTVLLRGSYSTGFRAPSLYEINSAQTYTNSNQYDDPVNCPGGTPLPGKPAAANCQQQFQTLTGGNKALAPEESKNYALGVVFEPVNNLSVGLDFWKLKLEHQIGQLNQDDVFGDPAKYASLYHRTAAGNLATDGSQCPNPLTCGYVDLRTQNLGGVNTDGLDVSVNYRWRHAEFGNTTFTLNSTYVHKYEYQNSDGGEWHQNVGVFSGTGPIFKWQNNASINWTKGIWGAGIAAHSKTGYIDQDPEFRVASYTTWDSYATANFMKNLSLTLGVRNMFDRAPPLSYQTETFQAGYDPRFTDPKGRTFYARATYNF